MVIHTEGIVNTFNRNVATKFFFFEVDGRDQKGFNEKVQQVAALYKTMMLDYLCHYTKNGVHFLSPTVISAYDWQCYMAVLKGVNPDCPMVTLRVLNNKYGNEEKDFYHVVGLQTYGYNFRRNSIDMCRWLNSTFKVKEFKGSLQGSLHFQKYRIEPRGEKIIHA